MLVPKDIINDFLGQRPGAAVADQLAAEVFSDHVEAFLVSLVSRFLPEKAAMSPTDHDISEELLMKDLEMESALSVRITTASVRSVIRRTSC